MEFSAVDDGANSWSRVGARKLRLREARKVKPSTTSQRPPTPQTSSEPAIELSTNRYGLLDSSTVCAKHWGRLKLSPRIGTSSSPE